jgi:hypothetical protein
MIVILPISPDFHKDLMRRMQRIPKESGHQNLTNGRCPNGENERS